MVVGEKDNKCEIHWKIEGGTYIDYSTNEHKEFNGEYMTCYIPMHMMGNMNFFEPSEIFLDNCQGPLATMMKTNYEELDK